MPDLATDTIVITALGATTSVGADAEQSCAAIRAGIVNIAEHEFYIPKQADEPLGEEVYPLHVSTVPILEASIEGADRFHQLALPALLDVLERAKLLENNRLQKCALFLSLPPVDAVTTEIELNHKFIAGICKDADLINLNMTKINQTGATGVFEHINDAVKMLRSEQLDYCIVGGVDTWLLEQRLDIMDAAWRLTSERNRDGFTPGEAATMMVLERAETAKSRGLPIMSSISGVGQAVEPETFSSEKNSTGQGLTQAVEAVLASSANNSFKTVYCDLDGESYYAFEWSLVQTRLGRSLANLKPLIHSAKTCGNVGAATGGLLVACATMTHFRGFDSGEDVLLWTASDNGTRAALSLQQVDIQKLP